MVISGGSSLFSGEEVGEDVSVVANDALYDVITGAVDRKGYCNDNDVDDNDVDDNLRNDNIFILDDI